MLFRSTETQGAVEACIKSRLAGIDTEIMLLTDGDIWDQNAMFQFLNKHVRESQGHLRVFPIGLGGGVSSALIEGIARAGNGFAQHVAKNEPLDGKIVRMLKGALTPHIHNHTLEVNYAAEKAQEDDDFELVETVTDSLEVDLRLNDKVEKPGAATQIGRAHV